MLYVDQFKLDLILCKYSKNCVVYRQVPVLNATNTIKTEISSTIVQF